MRRILGTLLAIATLGAVPAQATAKGPLNISAPPNATVTDPTADQDGPLRYAAIGQGDRTTLASIWTAGGELRDAKSVEGNWALPAVTLEGEAGGLSADGGTLVLIRPDYSFRPDKTRFLVLDSRRLRTREPITLDGSFSFDAISPDGKTIYFVEYNSPSDPLDYQVRAYDLSAGRLLPDPIVDPEEPEEQMGGYAVARGTSPDGRWTYTLYTGGEETFVHALDTVGETAACIDLHDFQSSDPYSSRLGLDVDPADGEMTVTERDAPAATIDPESFEVTPVSEGAATVPSGDGIGAAPLVAALGALGLAALAFFGIRRRRRRSEEADLERVFDAAGTEGTEPEAAERERLPVP